MPADAQTVDQVQVGSARRSLRAMLYALRDG